MALLLSLKGVFHSFPKRQWWWSSLDWSRQLQGVRLRPLWSRRPKDLRRQLVKSWSPLRECLSLSIGAPLTALTRWLLRLTWAFLATSARWDKYLQLFTPIFLSTYNHELGASELPPSKRYDRPLAERSSWGALRGAEQPRPDWALPMWRLRHCVPQQVYPENSQKSSQENWVRRLWQVL